MLICWCFVWDRCSGRFAGRDVGCRDFAGCIFHDSEASEVEKFRSYIVAKREAHFFREAEVSTSRRSRFSGFSLSAAGDMADA